MAADELVGLGHLTFDQTGAVTPIPRTGEPRVGPYAAKDRRANIPKLAHLNRRPVVNQYRAGCAD
ncbi:hypothetical protein NKI74_31780 [Mesorhizobium sp. M0494]|uniref:hypothetical protein n=1 Tax=Mesorhizobium sp. M0494 TaxID=2956951 RepID=UPI00333CACEB